MAKLSAEDQATLDRLTALRDAPDDDADDGAIWVRNGDGHETRLTGRRADEWLARNGYSDAAGDASTQDAPLTPGGKGKTPPAGKGKPAPRKQAARTSSATPPADDVDDDQDEGAEDLDAPARTGRRAFF